MIYLNSIKSIFLLAFKLIFKYLPFTKNILKISNYKQFVSKDFWNFLIFLLDYLLLILVIYFFINNLFSIIF